MSEMPRPVWCYHHCRERLAERYGVGLTVAQYKRLCKLLTESLRDPIAYGFNGREILRIWHAGRACTAVYDPDERLIITFLDRRAYRTHPQDRHARHRDRKLKQRKKAKWSVAKSEVERRKRKCDYVSYEHWEDA